jgi:hypothetical protein
VGPELMADDKITNRMKLRAKKPVGNGSNKIPPFFLATSNEIIQKSVSLTIN